MSLHDEIRSAQIRAGEDAVIRDLERLGLAPAAPKTESRLEVLEREHQEFFERWHAERRKREALEDAIRDIFPAAHRLALELECLLLDTKDTAAVSKWWDSGHEALEQWREYCREDVERPNAPHEGLGAASSRTVPLDAVVGPREER